MSARQQLYVTAVLSILTTLRISLHCEPLKLRIAKLQTIRSAALQPQPAAQPAAYAVSPFHFIRLSTPLCWVYIRTVSDIACMHRITGCCNAAHTLATVVHNACDCTMCGSRATAAVTVEQCNAAGGDAQTFRQAPVPLWAPATDGALVWAQPLPDAPFKLFKIVLRSQHGWQLDGHVRPSLTYSQTIMSVILTWP